jgi:hypothetical protein
MLTIKQINEYCRLYNKSIKVQKFGKNRSFSFGKDEYGCTLPRVAE